MSDSFNLGRFVSAQEPVWQDVCAELRAGRKRTHWMWFVFPQIAGLGRSATAQFYAIASKDEARAYLAHPVLGLRLLECARLVNAVEGKTAHDIFGTPDDVKFHSSMTLFALTETRESAFTDALARFFGGARDAMTIEALAGGF